MNRIKTGFLCLLLILTMAGTGCSRQDVSDTESTTQAEAVSEPADTEEVQEDVPEPDPLVLDQYIFRNLSYGDEDQQTFDLYIPENLDRNQPHPLVLLIHGGGWISGDKSSMQSDALRYQEAGFTAISMNYRLVQSSPEEMENQLQDISLCLENAVQVMSEYGVDLNQVMLTGYSAGGHLSLLYGTRCRKESPLPVTLLGIKAGVSDFHTEAWSGAEASYYLSLFGQSEDFVNSISPIRFIDENTPEILFVHGALDETVGTSQFSVLEPLLQVHGVPYTEYLLENSGHSLDNDPKILEAYYTDVIEKLRQADS